MFGETINSINNMMGRISPIRNQRIMSPQKIGIANDKPISGNSRLTNRRNVRGDDFTKIIQKTNMNGFNRLDNQTYLFKGQNISQNPVHRGKYSPQILNKVTDNQNVNFC